MGLGNRSRNTKERAIELLKERLEIQIKDKVKWVKEVNKKVILVSLKTWEDKQEVMEKGGQLKDSKKFNRSLILSF